MAGHTRDIVRLLLGDDVVAIANPSPTLTVLDWLREDRRLIGTKEGCAEGDCGACTVLVGRLDAGTVRYRAVNACICFIGTLDGCHLVTVEQLRRPGGALHPVQQAMVERHGSQCGFCTPGFVMALYALWLNEDAADTDRIEQALQGNLCRCTGYAPIVAAARQVFDRAERADDPLLADNAGTAARLAELDDDAMLACGGAAGRFIAPRTLEELDAILIGEPEATIVAGATDVGLWVTKQMRRLNPVVWLGRIEALRRLEGSGDGLEIGAGVTYTEAWPALVRLAPAFDELLYRLGGEQIRNMGTIGGNIANASPIGDMPPALIALGAHLVLRRDGAERVIALEDFFLDYGRQDRRPGEYVVAVRLKPPAPTDLFGISKISKRFDEDISAVCGAFRIARDSTGRIADCRIAFGGMAAIPKRAPAAEAAAVGRAWDDDCVEAIVEGLRQDYDPIGDWRASAGYRARVAANLVRRFHVETTAPARESRLSGPRRAADA